MIQDRTKPVVQVDAKTTAFFPNEKIDEARNFCRDLENLLNNYSVHMLNGTRDHACDGLIIGGTDDKPFYSNVTVLDFNGNIKVSHA